MRVVRGIALVAVLSVVAIGTTAVGWPAHAVEPDAAPPPIEEVARAADLVAYGELTALGADGTPPDAFTFVVYTPIVELPEPLGTQIVVAPPAPVEPEGFAHALFPGLVLGEQYVLFLERNPGDGTYGLVSLPNAAHHVDTSLQTDSGEWLWDLQTRIRDTLYLFEPLALTLPVDAEGRPLFHVIEHFEETIDPATIGLDPDAPTVEGTGTELVPAVQPDGPYQPTGWQFVDITNQGFESGFPGGGWSVAEPSGFGMWWDDQSACRVRNGSRSAWVAAGGPNARTPCNDYYPNSFNTWMIYGPADLSEATGVDWQFDVRGLVAAGDYLYYGYSINGSTWTWNAWGVSDTWFSFHAIFTQASGMFGDPSVWFALRFDSNWINRDYGVWIDNVRIAQYICAALPKPTGLTASDGAFLDRVHISWDAVPGATSYEVYRSPDGTGVGGTTLASVTDTTYDDTTAESGVTYWYWIHAEDVCGAGAMAVDTGWRHDGTCTLAVTDFRSSNFLPGSTLHIQWSGHALSLGGAVRIRLRKRTRTGWKTWTLADSTENDGSFNWDIPADWPHGKYKVLIQEVENPRACRAVSPFFQITDCTLEVTQPVGGEEYAPDDTVHILWRGVTQTGGDVKILAFRKTRRGWQTEATVAENTANDGTFAYTIPADARNGKYRFVIADVDAARACRAQSNPFFIRR